MMLWETMLKACYSMLTELVILLYTAVKFISQNIPSVNLQQLFPVTFFVYCVPGNDS